MSLVSQRVADVIRSGMHAELEPDAIAGQIVALFDDESWGPALRHPVRGQILDLLGAVGSLSPVRAAEVIDRPLAAISYHFRVLVELGFIAEAARRQRRGAVEHIYQLTARGSGAELRRPADLPPSADGLLQ